MSPITVNVRRKSVPISPAKTCPRFTPIQTGRRKLAVEDCTRRSQHSSFVVVLRNGNSGNEDDLAAVRVDVGRKERHGFRIGRGLHGA